MSSRYAVSAAGDLVKKSNRFPYLKNGWMGLRRLPAVLVFCGTGLLIADLSLLVQLAYLLFHPDVLEATTDLNLMVATFILCSLGVAGFVSVSVWLSGRGLQKETDIQHHPRYKKNTYK